MGITARWNGHIFEVSPNVIRSFKGLEISGACDTGTKDQSFKMTVPALDKKGNKQYDKKGNLKTKKVTKKNKITTYKTTKPIEISFSAMLHSMTGCDVRNEAMMFINDAESGEKDYLYIGGHKIASCEFMITKASVAEINISNNGWWMSAVVQITMSQAGTFDQTTNVPIAMVPTSIAAAASTTRFLSKASVRSSSTTTSGGTQTSVSDGIAAANSVIKAGKNAS